MQASCGSFQPPPTSPVLFPALVPPDFTKQSLFCTLLLHRSNVEATRVPACRERRQMPVKWPALQSLAQTRTGFQLDDAAHALAMTSNTVNSFSQQALALQVTSKGYLRCLTRHLPTLQPSKVASAQLEAVVDMMLMSQRFHLPWLPRSTQPRLYARA